MPKYQREGFRPAILNQAEQLIWQPKMVSAKLLAAKTGTDRRSLYDKHLARNECASDVLNILEILGEGNTELAETFRKFSESGPLYFAVKCLTNTCAFVGDFCPQDESIISFAKEFAESLTPEKTSILSSTQNLFDLFQ